MGDGEIVSAVREYGTDNQVWLLPGEFQIISGFVLEAGFSAGSIVDTVNYIAYLLSLRELRVESVVSAQIYPDTSELSDQKRTFQYSLLIQVPENGEFLLNQLPRLQQAETIDWEEGLAGMEEISSYIAEVFVIRNNSGSLQADLPSLFRRAGSFLRDNEFDVDVVENLECIFKYDGNFEAYPEIQITIRRFSDA